MADDLKALEALEKMLAEPNKILDLVAKSIAEEAIVLIHEEFDNETDPYGQKWRPKKRKDGRKTLSGKTGRLKTGWKVTRANHEGIVVSPSVEYALYHQDPQPRKRLSGRDVVLRNARGIDIGRIRKRAFDEDTHGPAQLTRPRRMMVPDPELGLPPKWERQFNETATEALTAIFGGEGGTHMSKLAKLLESSGPLGFKLG